MKSVAAALVKLQSDLRNLVMHSWLNRVATFVDTELPTLVAICKQREDAYEQLEQENERLKRRVIDLEQLLKEDKPHA